MKQDIQELGVCAYLMNPPFSLSTNIANNQTMEALSPDARRLDRNKAFEQWHAVYRFLAEHGLVYVLPSAPELQDLPFVANIGIMLPHLKKPSFILANFCSQPRIKEADHADAYFRAFGMQTFSPPYFFEGEADLKFIHQNLYCGGFGLRSSIKVHRWFEKNFAMRIISIECLDPNLYHLDCILHPIDDEALLLCTQVCSPEVIKAIEREVEIIPVDRELAYRGVTNSVNCGRFVLCESNLDTLSRKNPLWAVEIKKRRFWEDTATYFDREPVFFDNSEFYKSGAMLSCMVLPLNYRKSSRTDKDSCWLGRPTPRQSHKTHVTNLTNFTHVSS